MAQNVEDTNAGAAAGEAACRLPSRETLPRRTIYILLLLLCVAPYRGILDNGLMNDDYSWLKAARYDMTPGNVLGFRVVEFFRPLVNLSFFAMEKTSPGNVPLHYALNIVLHYLCTLLVYHLARNLLGGARLAVAVAALFAVTSVHAAAVQWISARTTLLSAFFLLASINLVVSTGGRFPFRLAGAIGLYVLALASKEEAIAALFLVPFLLASRKEKGLRGEAGLAAAAFVAVSAAYLVLRYALMDGLFRDNWGLGAHAARNVGGAFLYQLYPWPFFSLFYPRGSFIGASASSYSPEIVAIPVAAVLLAAGWAARRARETIVAVGWALLTLLPAAFFRYRFFSTDSLSQNRYYYLSSVGTTILVVLLLAMLWNGRSRARKAVAAVVFVVICAGSVVRDVRLERKWDDFTSMYREAVAAIVEEGGRYPGVTTIAVENPPLAFPYLADAIALERPAWKTVEVKGGRAEAANCSPCVYVSYAGDRVRRMSVELVSGAAEAGTEAGAR